MFERHDDTVAQVIRLIDAGQYAEARDVAGSTLAELRGAWGYDGRTAVQKSYIRQFMGLRAHACRKLAGVVVVSH